MSQDLGTSNTIVHQEWSSYVSNQNCSREKSQGKIWCNLQWTGTMCDKVLHGMFVGQTGVKVGLSGVIMGLTGAKVDQMVT